MDAVNHPFPNDLLTSLMRTRPLVALTSPVIYSLIIPFAIADLWVSLYQAICFPVYGVEPVRRAPYFALDRAKLPYLNAIEKLNCVYCTYVQGVIAYVREVAARTEQYWCPIKHAKERPDAHERYADFAAYGAPAELAERRGQLRAALRSGQTPRASSAPERSVTPAVRPLR